ncbi:helix-turn-helix domain-containing protein [Treponema sp. R80B11-R83G3]
MSEIGERIKILRKETGLKQGDFAKRLEISQSLLSGIENGNEPLSDRTKKIICFEFNVNENWLLNGIGGMIRVMEKHEELLAVFRKLEPEGQKEVQKYADERLELQKFREDVKKAWNDGLKKAAKGEKRASKNE